MYQRNLIMCVAKYQATGDFMTGFEIVTNGDVTKYISRVTILLPGAPVCSNVSSKHIFQLNFEKMSLQLNTVSSDSSLQNLNSVCIQRSAPFSTLFQSFGISQLQCSSFLAAGEIHCHNSQVWYAEIHILWYLFRSRSEFRSRSRSKLTSAKHFLDTRCKHNLFIRCN